MIFIYGEGPGHVRQPPVRAYPWGTRGRSSTHRGSISRTLTAPGYEDCRGENFRRHATEEEVDAVRVLADHAHGAGSIDAILTTKLIRYEERRPSSASSPTSPARKRTEQLLQSLNAAALAMEQALTPAEIFPVAARVLCRSRPRQRRVPHRRRHPAARSRLHCWGSGAGGEVRVAEPRRSAGRRIGRR